MFMKIIWERCRSILADGNMYNCTLEDILFRVKGLNRGTNRLVNHFIIPIKYITFIGREKKIPLLIVKSKIRF